MTEQIELKVAKSGTTVQFFDTHLEPDGVSTFRAYIIFNQNNQPIQIGTFEAEPFYLDQNNHMVLVSSLGLPYLTGSTKTQDLSYILSDIQKTRISNRWAQSMALTFSGQSRSYTMFSDTMVNDMFINVSLHRSSSSLDTLNVYNNLVNSFPAQESTTGTLFGRLIATQKIVDTNGNNIHIPLKNVPIGIFNPTEEFPSPASTDDDGNRITLNLKEYSPASLYFNEQSYSADTGSDLHSGYAFTAVPAFYKYVTTTNDEGEFVLHNVPTGTQTIFFEVDLFKQGLTQDEIALNFFPFPADNEPNISSYPHLFFRQFQVDIIPTWGTLQTGYTETNISVALDLRKWATYFVEQISFNNLDFDALLMKGITTPLTISIRNMAQEGFPVGNTEVVEIVDMIDRDLNHVMLWRNEFKQLKSKAQFYVDGYHAFKLPANMYDPVGTKTDKNGFPTDSKGVWLAGYQLSMYYSDKSVLFRNTGSSKIRLDDGTYVTRDHYNLNKSNTDITQQNASAPPSNGDFPYERKWDHMYPEPYSIPSIPVEPNPQFDVLNDQGKRIVERPRFIDGDIVGKPFHSFLDPDNLYGGTGGYGVAVDETDNEWFKTDFSKAVTKNYVYRYENTEDPNSKYATGYMPNSQDFPLQPGISSVKKEIGRAHV